MEPSSSSSSISSTSTRSPSSSSAKLPDPMDGLLAGAGYNVRSSDLRHVAHQLESLETVMVSGPSSQFSDLANDAVLYNPSDLSSWVDTLLSGVDPSHLVAPAFTNNYSSFNNSSINNNNNAPPVLVHPQNSQQFITALEEDYSISLAHGLMTCAQSVHRGDFSLALRLVEELQTLLTRVNSGFGFGKVAGYFIDALNRRLWKPQANHSSASAFENEILYHHFYEACPYLKFAHFTANQAILEAFHGHDHVHVIDFNLMQGLQWPALIQALALRPGGPPALRLTGIGPPSPDGHDSLRDIGLRLAELSRSVNVPFSFRGVAASRLDDVQPWMLQVDPKEAVAVNSIMQLHKLLDNDPARIDAVLGWIHGLSPKIMTLVEQESNHNQTDFLDRFTEALHYYSTMFDSLEACPAQPEKSLAEIYIQREICNVVCCEGSARIERHEPLLKWRGRLNEAGFTPLFLGSNAYKQASMLLTLFSAEGYCVEENEGCLTLGWHSRPLIAASAWHVETEQPNSPVVV